MSKLERLTIDVPEFVAEKIEAAVEAGEFAEPADAVEQALGNWAMDRLDPDELERLGRAYDEGLASGVAEPLDMSELIREAKAEKRARERKVG